MAVSENVMGVEYITSRRGTARNLITWGAIKKCDSSSAAGETVKKLYFKPMTSKSRDSFRENSWNSHELNSPQLPEEFTAQRELTPTPNCTVERGPPSSRISHGASVRPCNTPRQEPEGPIFSEGPISLAAGAFSAAGAAWIPWLARNSASAACSRALRSLSFS